jgi:hypothetical protein
MNVPAETTRTVTDLVLVAERAMRDPTVDVEKLQRILDIIELNTLRANERGFNTSLVLAQGEMEPINADASNPQTRSKYATFSHLDQAIRPIYTKHGLAPSFNTEPSGEPNTILVVGLLGHRDGHVRRYSIPMPIDTKGAKGTEYMTRTHATGSAFSYGKRYLLIGMFNLTIDDEHDDDGSGGRRRAPPIRRDLRPMQHSSGYADAGADTIDQETGEVIETVDPYTIEMNPGSTWAQFLEPLQRCILAARTIAEVDEWLLKNQTLLIKLKESKPQLFKLFEQNIEPHKEALTRT